MKSVSTPEVLVGIVVRVSWRRSCTPSQKEGSRWYTHGERPARSSRIRGNPGVYTPNPQHRNAAYANQKSQWTIPIPDEYTCYNTATASGWCGAQCGWGLHLEQGVPAPVGSSSRANQLYIAKFVQDQNVWHGYPIAHWLSPFDKPSDATLQSWEASGFINRATRARIYRGKRCSL